MSQKQDCILIINAGSSSVKFAAFAIDSEINNPQRLNYGQIEFKAGGNRECNLLVLSDIKIPLHPGDSDIQLIDNWLTNANLNVVAIGHRVVHGGDQFKTLAKISPATIRIISSLHTLAPLHQHQAVYYIKAMKQFKVPQFAYFDTAFHSTMSTIAQRVAIPNRFLDDGIKRYGFHGIAYESVLAQLEKLNNKPNKILAAHLGNGSSMCAILDGRSVDTTMSFTPLDGLIMGTRCGTLDPGIILHLQQNYQMTTKELTDLLYKNSGLKGISELSSDMRILEKESKTNPKAQLAVEMFCYNAIKKMFGLIGAMGGIDMLVFSGGIGENSSYVRSKIARSLQWLGLIIDEGANQQNNLTIQNEASKIQVRIAKIDEEMVIASKIIDCMLKKC